MNRPLPTRRSAFSVVEVLVGAALMTGLIFTATAGYLMSSRQSMKVSDLTEAMQNAYLLMETLQQDLKQMAVKPGRGFPVFPYSLVLSAHGKSFTMRRSASATDLGSSFSLVTYQLVPARIGNGYYSFKRLERSPEGDALPGEADLVDRDKALENLIIKDIKAEFVARMEGEGKLRQFLELTLLAVSLDDRGDRNKAVVYPVSNLFELPSPEAPEDFSRDAYVEAPKNITADLGNVPVLRGRGNEQPISAPPDLYAASGGQQLRLGSDDEVDQARPSPFTQGLADINSSRRTWVYGIMVDIASALGPGYQGRIVGEVVDPESFKNGGTPTYREPFSIEVDPRSKVGVPEQVEKILATMKGRGNDAVKQFLAMFNMRPSDAQLGQMF